MELYITKSTSKSGKPYIALYRHKGDKDIFITFEPATMCRLSGLLWLDIKDIKVGERITL